MSTNPRTDFRPLRPLKQWDRINPHAFDPTIYTFIPDRAVDNAKIANVSPRKIDLIGGKIYSTAVANTLANTTVTDITFDTTLFSRGVTVASTYKTMKVPHTGVYILTANVEWAADDGGRSIWFYINGSQTEGNSVTNDAASFATKQSLTTIRRLTSGDTVGMQARQSSGGNLAIQDGEDNCSLSVVYMGTI